MRTSLFVVCTLSSQVLTWFFDAYYLAWLVPRLCRLWVKKGHKRQKNKIKGTERQVLTLVSLVAVCTCNSFQFTTQNRRFSYSPLEYGKGGRKSARRYPGPYLFCWLVLLAGTLPPWDSVNSMSSSPWKGENRTGMGGEPALVQPQRVPAVPARFQDYDVPLRSQQGSNQEGPKYPLANSGCKSCIWSCLIIVKFPLFSLFFLLLLLHSTPPSPRRAPPQQNQRFSGGGGDLSNGKTEHCEMGLA